MHYLFPTTYFSTAFFPYTGMEKISSLHVRVTFQPMYGILPIHIHRYGKISLHVRVIYQTKYGIFPPYKSMENFPLRVWVNNFQYMCGKFPIITFSSENKVLDLCKI